MQKQLILLALLGIFLIGCSNKIIYETAIVDQQAYNSRFKPIIGSRNNDARTVIDFGIVAKVWIAPYKDQYGVLVAGHDIYVWLERPDFVPGSAVPMVNGDSKGIPTQVGKMPFSISPAEIDRSKLDNDESIHQFVNESYKNTDGSIMDKLEAQADKEEKAKEQAKKKK